MQRLIFLVLAALAISLTGCRKKRVEPVVPEPFVEAAPRAGPGFSWQLETTAYSTPTEYYSSGFSRQYFLKGSDQYVRSVTLKVTKTGASNVIPRFHIYKEAYSCLAFSDPVAVSSGFYEPVSWRRYAWDDSWKDLNGYAWTPLLDADSAVGSVATFTLNVYPARNGCLQGAVMAAMDTPVAIPSVNNFTDGDYLEFVVDTSL